MTMLDDAAAATAGGDEGERIGSCDGYDIKTIGAVQCSAHAVPLLIVIPMIHAPGPCAGD